MATSSNWVARIVLCVAAVIGAADAARTAYAAPILPGDFDLNGTVDGHDILSWQRHINTSLELDNWKAHYGEPYFVAPAATPTPEPGSATLLAGLGGWLALQGRRRRDPRSVTGG